MKEQIEAVKTFQEVFKHGFETKPSLIELDEVNLRFRLMEEENNEYLEACYNQDMVGIADALGDQLYVLLGSILQHGLQDKIVEVFDEIHRSNMSKLGEDGEPIYQDNGKVAKGPNYFKPDIRKIIEE